MQTFGLDCEDLNIGIYMNVKNQNIHKHAKLFRNRVKLAGSLVKWGITHEWLPWSLTANKLPL